MILEVRGDRVRCHVLCGACRLLPGHHGVAEIVVETDPRAVQLLNDLHQLVRDLIFMVLEGDADAALLQLRDDLAKRHRSFVEHDRIEIAEHLCKVILAFAAGRTCRQRIQGDRDVGTDDIRAECLCDIQHLQKMLLRDALRGELHIHMVGLEQLPHLPEVRRIVASEGSPLRIEIVVLQDIDHDAVEAELVGFLDVSEDIHALILKPKMKTFCIKTDF